MNLDELESFHAAKVSLVKPGSFTRYGNTDYFKTGDFSKESFFCINGQCSSCKFVECRCKCHAHDWSQLM